ncbi:transmembrane protein 17-like [Nilaparvata lugens]|uniref:transmembrane protein 17-like n=1 Tax=Nilaparvata lugens TaxID=108931 RepID=UPI00193CEF60|nr:transmembrane protein 17-like [Nilaparvata lugens]
MTEGWKQTVTNVSEHFFPGLSYYNNDEDDEFIKLGNEVVSNLPLQMSLYFNVVFFPVWLITTLLTLYLKIGCLSMLYQIIVLVVVTLAVLIELFRLYLGYRGNLCEMIPELAGFFMLTAMLQTPLQLFLLVGGSGHGAVLRASVLERCVQTVQVCLLAVQLVSGCQALRNAARHSAQQFHIARFKMAELPSRLQLRTKST